MPTYDTPPISKVGLPENPLDDPVCCLKAMVWRQYDRSWYCQRCKRLEVVGGILPFHVEQSTQEEEVPPISDSA